MMLQKIARGSSLGPSGKPRLDAGNAVPLDAIASNLEARQAMGPSFSDPSFVQKNYKMPAPPLNEAARQDFVEKLHVPRSHHKADEATKLLCDLLEVGCSACSCMQVAKKHERVREQWTSALCQDATSIPAPSPPARSGALTPCCNNACCYGEVAR